MTAARRTHVPDFGRAKTLCGKLRDEVACIDLARDPVDSATCTTCHKSDDARTRREYRKTEEWKREQEVST